MESTHIEMRNLDSTIDEKSINTDRKNSLPIITTNDNSSIGNEKVKIDNRDESSSVNSDIENSNFIHISRIQRYLLFTLMILTSFLLNTDHGTIPAAIEEIQNSLNIDKSQVGTFGSSVYIGVSVGALFLSFFINKINRKYMVAISFFCSGVLIFLFIFIKIYWILFIDRFLVGFAQALISIYIPVWIDQYIPVKFKTVFLSVFQISSLVGMIIGYIFTYAIKKSYDVSIFIILSGV